MFFLGNTVQPAAVLEQRHLTADDRFVDISGLRVRLREQGPAGAPQLVMLHGFTSSLETFDALAGALCGDYRVVRMDLAGHGLTGPDPLLRYDVRARAQFLGELVGALGLGRFSLVGHSLGGSVAWRFAAANTDRLDSLVLISAPAFPFNGVGARPDTPDPMMAQFFAAPTGDMVAAMVAGLMAHPGAISRSRMEQIVDMIQRDGNGAASVDHLRQFCMPDPREDLSAIACPTLVVWGDQDGFIACDQAHQIAGCVPQGAAVFIDGAGHVPHEEKPEQTLAALKVFLAERTEG